MKKKKRDGVQFPGLVKGVNSKVKQEYMDQDYINKLSNKEKQYLSNFNEEFYGGNFKHKGKKLHRTDEERRDCYNRNNARNRCAYGLKKAGGLVIDSDLPAEQEESISEEDQMIDLIESKEDEV